MRTACGKTAGGINDSWLGAPVFLHRADRHSDCRDGRAMTRKGEFQSFKPSPVPEGVPAIVRDLFKIMTEQRIGVREIAKRSGVHGNTILTWRASRVPSISNFEAVANALGYELHLVRRTPT
jgi:2,3-bisphosphoglycerate-independent phosphoglycerate mutase